MKRIIPLTKEDVVKMVNETVCELSNMARLRRNMNGGDNGLNNVFASSPDKYNPQNPRHQKGYDALRDWANYVCQKRGYDSNDVSKVLTRNPIQNLHNRDRIRELLASYQEIFDYCVNTLKLRPGVVKDIAGSVGEDLLYGMLN